MNKLLILGASGFLGWNLCNHAKKKWHVIGTYFKNPLEISGCSMIGSNLFEKQDIDRLFNQVQPDAVIFSAAASNPNFCQNNPDVSYVINVTAPAYFAKLAAERDITFLFTSSDLVFDGTNPPYNEQSPVSPISVYGEHKAKAEQLILSNHKRALVCRLPLMFGNPSPTSESFLQPMIKSLKESKPITLFTDEVRTPASAQTVASGLLHLLGSTTGIIHLGGKERISRYDFGLLLTELFHFDKSLIKPVLQSEVAMAAPRPPDVSLDSSFAFSKGYTPCSIIEELRNLAIH